jgi:hypothetical protein
MRLYQDSRLSGHVNVLGALIFHRMVFFFFINILMYLSLPNMLNYVPQPVRF